MNHFTFPNSASTAFARQKQQQQFHQQYEYDEENNGNGITDSHTTFPRRSPNNNYTISQQQQNEGFPFKNQQDQLLSPISQPNSPWNQLSDGLNNSRTPPADLGSYFNRASNTPSPSNQKSNRGVNMMASSSSGGGGGMFGVMRNNNHSSGSSGSHVSGSGFYSAGGGTRLAPAIEDDDEDRLFFQRDSILLPRRNHTIASGSSKYGRRLMERQQFPPFPATSPGKNSLSAITGGKEEGDDDWEAMMKRKESLIPNVVDEETEVLDNSAWQAPISLNAISSHRRFPSQPTSVLGTSPIDSHHSPISNPSNSIFHHQRSESAHASSLAQGPFASSPVIPGSAFGSNAGIVRRHQSLNYHAGRQMANRMNKGHGQEAIGSGAKVYSPVHPTGSEAEDQLQSSHSPQHNTLRSNQLEGYDNAENNNLAHSSKQLSSSLMDAHAQMARLSLFNNNNNETDNISRSSPPKQTFSDIRPKLPSLITNRDVLAKSKNGGGGPVSASAYVPPIGHGHYRQSSSTSIAPSQFPSSTRADHFGSVGRQNALSHHREPQTAFPGSQSRWQTFDNEHVGSSFRSPEQNEDENLSTRKVQAQGIPWTMDPSIMRTGNLNDALHHQQDGGGGGGGGHGYYSNVNGNVAMQTYNNHPNLMGLQANQHHQVWNNTGNAAYTTPLTGGMGMSHNVQQTMSRGPQQQYIGNPMLTANQQQQQSQHIPSSANKPPSTNATAMDARMRALLASKGYNPPLISLNVDGTRARFFVIKSFTEDDVQRSLKHEIWASTEKGNQRLDRAFKESHQEGPLYLLFSVNASGHFCGIAEMLTSVDFTSDSNVWVQEGKWKGTFKVRWIYVKDVPNNKLRHIRLTNTAECKPITQSRDTQELPPDGGKQAFKIIAEYQSRTTLLQSWLSNDDDDKEEGQNGQTQ